MQGCATNEESMKSSLRIVTVCGVLLVVLGAWGCSPRYSHPQKSEYLWEIDYNMCVVQADYAVQNHPYSTTASRPYVTRFEQFSPRYREFIQQCMEDKGYSFEDDPKELLFGDGDKS